LQTCDEKKTMVHYASTEKATVVPRIEFPTLAWNRGDRGPVGSNQRGTKPRYPTETELREEELGL